MGDPKSGFDRPTASDTVAAPSAAAVSYGHPLFLTVSGSRGLLPTTAAAVERLVKRERRQLTIVHQGTIDLTAITRNGRPVVSVPTGAGIPMSVFGVDPTSIGATTSPNVAALTQSGAVVVGETASKISGIAVGDDITLTSWSAAAVQVRVGAIVADREADRAEIMMSIATAATLGLDRPFYVRIWGFPDASALGALETQRFDQRLHVRSSEDQRGPDDPIPQAQLKQALGTFWIKRGPSGHLQVDPAWKTANVREVDLPIIGPLTCNRKVAAAAARALSELQSAGLGALIHGPDSRRNGGCFSARVTRSLTGNSGHNLSRHTWGSAIDLNPTSNPYGGPSSMDPRVIAAFRRNGFVWGGSFIEPDPMHFEYSG
jgi:D-alanyl-D-alanine carboxypeptidase